MPALPSGLIRPPMPFDDARAQRIFAMLADRGFVPADEAARSLLAGAFGNSGFLGRLAVREVATLRLFFESGPEAVLQASIAMAGAVGLSQDDAIAMTDLRIAKRRAALAVALADLAGLWDLAAVTDALTRFADAAVGGALRFLLHGVAAREPLWRDKSSGTLEATTGLTVLAMGKYGGCELNYSSDIDLVVFYDADRFPFARRGDPRGAAVEIVRGLVRLLAETNADGYVFRVDLRLRPDAGATQIAISTAAAEAYYESQGQNWERAAFIKARMCAGDPQTGRDILAALVPFIWRRHLDFAAIADIHAIKRQIHAHAGHREVAVAGHNIKLGRGGIREIEFFVQTQQLILGGRYPSLRAGTTLGALDALAAHGTIDGTTADAMARSYVYLRTLEHRLQMVEDEQTHSVPRAEEGIAQIACFMGYPDAAAFNGALTGVLKTVQGHYARLFEHERDLTHGHGDLVFTGVDNDPETLRTLAKMGFSDPGHVARAIRVWHHGRMRAMRSARARELLTRLLPSILAALSGAADADAAFAQFDRFLSNLPSGVQLFSLFLARPEFLNLLARVVGAAPRLAGHLARTPATLDALLDDGFLGRLPSHGDLDRALARRMSGAYEEMLDAARRFAREEIFRVGVQIVEGAARASNAGPALAAIAETVIAALLPKVAAELADNAGVLPDASFAVIAMGKLGGREMTASSDLDLIFVYDVPEAVEFSDGAKPLEPTLYFARLAQRLIAALTAHTAAGALYDVDMRLRPTGNKGPVAVRLTSFIAYHASESWTWEHMALTRARVVAGPPALAARIRTAIADRLTSAPDSAKVIGDAREMRGKIAAQFPGRHGFDLKYAPGGLVDIEFIAQALQLLHAHQRPDILDTNTIAALDRLTAAGFLSADDGAALIAAATLQQGLTQTLRIALDEPLQATEISPGLKQLLLRAAAPFLPESTDFAGLEEFLAERQGAVRAIFDRLIGPIALTPE